ncbi:MAG: DUF362 domain-containing protein [Pseudomonadota bacterium]
MPSKNIVIKKCTTYDKTIIKEKIIESIKLIGGIDNFVKAKDKILIKPNFLRPALPEKHILTHPSIILATIELLKDHGYHNLSIGDSPAFGTLKGVLKKLNIIEDLEKLDVKITPLQTPKAYDIAYTKYKKIELSQEAMEFDKIINLAKVKTHAQMTMTLSVKNLFGLVVGLEKPQWHLKLADSKNVFAELLIAIYKKVKPSLSIVDGITIMEGNGPAAGTPRDWGYIITGQDCIAIDHVICQMLDISPKRVPYLDILASLNISGYGTEDIQCLGDSTENSYLKNLDIPTLVPIQTERIPKFLLPLLQNFITDRPNISHKDCTLCNTCVNICPAKVMSVVHKKVFIDYKNCIRCYCCQETCPEEAIDMKKGFLLKLLRSLKWN